MHCGVLLHLLSPLLPAPASCLLPASLPFPPAHPCLLPALLLCQVEAVEPDASLDGVLPNIGGTGGYFDHDEVNELTDKLCHRGGKKVFLAAK